MGITKLFEPKKPTSKAETIRFWIGLPVKLMWTPPSNEVTIVPSKLYYYDYSLEIKG